VSEVQLRRASDLDLPSILGLNRVGNGDDIEVEMDIAFRFGAMAPSDYAVAAVDGRVVATVGLLATQLRLGTVDLPVGQPEFVATDPAHQGRGLAGGLLRMVQAWSEERGDLVQVITGIRYFYRQFGYSYGLVRAPEIVVAPEQDLVVPPGWEVRAAEAGDVDRIRALQVSAQAGVDVAMPFAPNLWPAFLEMAAAPLLVGVKDGRVESFARLRLGPDAAPRSPVYVQAVAASPSAAVMGVQAMLAGAQVRNPGATLVVADRDGSATRAVVGVGPCAARVAHRKWVYVRVPSLARVLSALTPVLDDRLSRSSYARESAELTISLYRSSVRLVIAGGRVVEVSSGPGVHEPDEDGAVGIPPELVPLLLFGEGGVAVLEDDPDVYLGAFGPLMAALFPPLRLDILTW
jgi:predicted N-acetyltransferase YhbS